MVGGVTAAAGISLINVGGLACIAGYFWRYIRARNIWVRSLSYMILTITIVSVVLWNLFVGHYRDAHEYEFPAETSPTEEVQVDQTPSPPTNPEARAVWLFTNNGFSLGGFESYLLMFIGIGLFGVAAWKWNMLDSNYPGYVRYEQKRVDTMGSLNMKRDDVLEHLSDKWKKSQVEVRYLFVDMVELWDHSNQATIRQQHLYDEYLKKAQEVAAQFENVIALYRTVNRQNRDNGQAVPKHWDEKFEWTWVPLSRPALIELCQRDHARSLRESEKIAMQSRIEQIEFTYNSCVFQVRKLSVVSIEGDKSRLDLPHDAKWSEVERAVQQMARDDGWFGLPGPTLKKLSVSEAKIKQYYQSVVDELRKQFLKDLRNKAEDINRLFLKSASGELPLLEQEDYKSQDILGQTVGNEMEAYLRGASIELEDLQNQEKEAFGAFLSAKNEFDSEAQHAKETADEARENLVRKKGEVIKKLRDLHKGSRDKIEEAFPNLLIAWEESHHASRECHQLHDDFFKAAEELQDQYLSALRLYRDTNQESRPDTWPPPPLWNAPIDVSPELFGPSYRPW